MGLESKWEETNSIFNDIVNERRKIRPESNYFNAVARVFHTI